MLKLASCFKIGIALWDHLYTQRHAIHNGERSETQPPYLIIYNAHRFIKPSLNKKLKRISYVSGENLNLHGNSKALPSLCQEYCANHNKELSVLRVQLGVLKARFTGIQMEKQNYRVEKGTLHPQPTTCADT